jgi:hypothetical protein
MMTACDDIGGFGFRVQGSGFRVWGSRFQAGYCDREPPADEDGFRRYWGFRGLVSGFQAGCDDGETPPDDQGLKARFSEEFLALKDRVRMV